MSSIFELDTDGWSQKVRDAQNGLAATEADARPDWYVGSLKGLGNGLGRGLVNAMDFLSSALPDGSPPPEFYETEVAPQIDPDLKRQFTEEARRAALDFWTPRPEEVGVLGRVLGGLGEMAPPLIAGLGNPTVLAGTQTLATGKRLVDEGVDARTAGLVAATEGLATYGGAQIPILGKTLGQRVFTGAAGNLGVGLGTTFAEQKLLEGNGYEELAQQYDPLDPEGRAVDLLMGAAFGVIAHHGGPHISPSDRAAVMAASNARHFQVDTAPGRPLDAAASAAHQKAMATALDQLDRGEHVNVPPEVLTTNFEERPARAAPDPDVIRETIGEVPEPRVRVEEPSGPVGDAAIRNPLTFDASPEVKLQELKALTAENVPLVRKIVDQLNERLAGSESKLNIKEDANILSKAVRPSILEKKPYFGVEHIRDALRFKTVIDHLDQLPEIVTTLEQNGVKIVKVDTDKLMRPGDWGWRIVALDLRMPNGQLVEHYMPLKELEAAKKAEGHKLFEKWRNEDEQQVMQDPARAAEYLRDRKKSVDLYQAAWESALARTGADDSAALASLKSFSTRASSLMENQSAVSPTFQPVGDSQRPSGIRTAKRPGAKTLTMEPSGDSEAVASRAIADSSGEIIPEAGLDSPVITAAKTLLEQQDVMIPTGAVDADGNPVVVSARELAAKWEQDVAAAERESVKFEAAVSCFLTQGTE